VKAGMQELRSEKMGTRFRRNFFFVNKKLKINQRKDYESVQSEFNARFIIIFPECFFLKTKNLLLRRKPISF
jgi:hypothetical protein